MVRLFASVLAVGVFASSVFAEEITAKGSDSTMPLVKALAEAYQKTGGNTVKLDGGGSSKGAEACMAGTVQLCFLSRELKDAEKEAGMVGVSYAHDAVAVIVHKDNANSDITVEQLRDMYTGKTANWPDGKPVVMFNRNEDSGTRECFDHAVMNKEKFSDKAQIKHAGVALTTVAKVPTAVAYMSAGEVNDTVKCVKVNGIAATPENIRSKSYPICRTLTFATKAEATPAVKSFIDFCTSEAGQKLIAEHHYVPVMEGIDAKAVASGEHGKSN
jgi:phosphate transport system substrate-binding protein